MIQIVVTRKTLPARSLLGPEVACSAPAPWISGIVAIGRSVLEFPRAIFFGSPVETAYRPIG